MKKQLTLLLLALLAAPNMMAQDATASKPQPVKPDQIEVYKTTPKRDLSLHIFYPEDASPEDSRPVVIHFFGGGWVKGSVKQFYNYCQYYASIGIVAISVDYRVAKKDGTTPFEAVEDAKSAVRWVRENCETLGIDPSRVVVSGGSAGGHLAACTAIIDGYEDYSHLACQYNENELAENCADLSTVSESSIPNAVILFNPVVNTTAAGYGADILASFETLISPVHHIHRNLPPTLIIHGTKDKTVPFANVVEFTEKMHECQNVCKLIPVKGRGHGFFNGTYRPKVSSPELWQLCVDESTKFLEEIGFISSTK